MTEAIVTGAPMRASSRLGPRLAERMDGGGIILRRWAGCWIDFIALGLIAFLFMAIGSGQPWAGVPIAVGLLAMLAYFPVTEGLWGRSLGKLITGTIVIDAAGRPPGVPRAIVRTLLRLVEVNPFFLGGIPAGLFAAFTKHHQRLGDMAAGTYVVTFSAWEKAKTADVDPKVFD